MKNNKFFLAAIVGSVVFFLLGYLVFGVLLNDFLTANSGMDKDTLAKFNKTMEQFNWYSMALSHLAGGFAFATIAVWTNARTFGAGAKIGGVIGLLFALNVNCLHFGVSNMFTLNSLGVQTACVAVIFAIITGIMAMILGTGKTTVQS